jgi:hypothetical protein
VNPAYRTSAPSRFPPCMFSLTLAVIRIALLAKIHEAGRSYRDASELWPVTPWFFTPTLVTLLDNRRGKQQNQ